MCGTDVNNPDTDGDGLLDGDEMYVETNPLIYDTDQDGISDSDEDYDSDGLTNAQEYNTDTCMFIYDTDFDGINDYDELYVYGTNPGNEDSDSDSIVDGDELILGLIPSTDDSDNDGTSDEYELFEQSLSVDITAEDHPHCVTSVGLCGSISGLISSNTTIEDMYSKDVYCTDVVGLVGVPISIESKGHFDSMTLTFNYDDGELGETSEENLGVLWFDESTGFFIVQDQAQIDTDNNVVSVELSHFSTYMLVDLSIWNNIEHIDYDIPVVERGIDYYVGFDLSQNMTLQARRNAYTAFQTLVNNMEDGDRVIIFYFDTNYVIDDLYYAGDAAEMNDVLGRVYNNLMGVSLGGDYGSLLLPFQIAEALINQGVNDIGNARELVIFTNDTEQIHTATNLNEMLYRKAAGGFTSDFIITENVNNGQWNFAWQYAEETNSGYYKYPSYTALNSSIANYRILSDFNVDTDSDGIPDYKETQGMLASNGQKYYLNPNNRDTDEDTLSDGEEIGATYCVSRSGDGRNLTISINGTVVYSSQYGSVSSDSQYYFLESFANTVQPGENAEIFVPLSDPNMPDSDEDGYLDYEDARPNVVNPDMIYVFANPDFRYLAANRANMYRQEGLSVRFREFNGNESFINDWDGIGLYDEYYLNGDKPYDDRYYYNAKSVVIVSHGAPYGFCLGSIENSGRDLLVCSAYDEFSTSVIRTGDLVDKKIESLNLYACSCGGEYTEGDNIAVDFLEKREGIQQVVAADTTLWVYGDNRMFFKAYNDTVVWPMADYIHLKLSVGQEDYVGDSWLITDFTKYDNPSGFIVFTRGHALIDCYSGDVFSGTLYGTERSLADQSEGIIVFSSSISEELGDVYYDPVIN